MRMPENRKDDRLEWRQISRYLSDQQQCIRTNAVFESIGSTNDWALEQLKSPQLLPAVCFAEHQSQGRGRQGRVWVSPRSMNVYMSLAWSFSLSVAEIGGLSLAAAFPIARVLRERGVDARLKWPNDVWVNGSKIAGVLLETRVKANGTLGVVIGIGLNVAMPDVQMIDQQWTDMSRQVEDRGRLDRNEIAGSLLAGLVDVCERYQQSGFGQFIDQWNDLDLCKGADLEIVNGDRVFNGTGLGIDNLGRLGVRVDGEDVMFVSADVRVRVRS